jgi:hypothetical protein
MTRRASDQRDTIRVFGVIAMLLGAAGVGATWPAHAADKYDGSAPLLCIPSAVTECGADGDCEQGTAESVHLPLFFKVDLTAKTVRAEEEGRVSPIKDIQRTDGRIVLHGAEAQRAWVMIIQEKTGKMSATIAGEEEGFLVFGVCAVP